jgi:hypothetical protein
MSLNEALRQLKSASRGRIPAETAAIMSQATEQLKASATTTKALGPGTRAPEFILEDWQGNKYRSAELLSKGPLVLSFYRGSW